MALLGYNGGLRGKPRTPSTSNASGIWDLDEQKIAASAGIWPSAGGDPYWANVSLLLRMDGSNGSTTFTDSSSNAFAITASGDAQISTIDPRFGTGSLTLDGNGDYLSTPADSAFAFGTGDYTVECWVYVNSGNGNNGLFTFGAENAGLCVAIVSGSWCMGFAGVSSGGSAGVMGNVGTTGTWQHLAVTRSGTYARMFIDGVQLGDVFGSSTDLYSNQLRIGYYYNNAYAINARVDEFRVTKGIARYTSNFTPPTAPFPNF